MCTIAPFSYIVTSSTSLHVQCYIFTIAYQHHNTHIFTIIDQLNMNDTIKYIMYIGSLPRVLSWIWPSLRYSHCSLFLVDCSLSGSIPSIRFSLWLLLSSSLNVLLVVLRQFVVIVSNCHRLVDQLAP